MNVRVYDYEKENSLDIIPASEWEKPKPRRKKKSNLGLTIILLSIILFLFCSIGVNIYAIYKIKEVQNQYTEIKQSVNESNEANQQVLAMLKEIKNTQAQQNGLLQKTVARKQTINLLKENGISSDTDLSIGVGKLTASDMDKIINYYDSKVGCSRFKGKGYVFIQASKESGLSPIYIFAHAALESGFGSSHLARVNNNYFGINAIDADPGQAYHMGDSVDQGIINGAIWIKRNYYDNGYTTLNSMSSAGYATDKNWSYKISNIANTSIRAL